MDIMNRDRKKNAYVTKIIHAFGLWMVCATIAAPRPGRAAERSSGIRIREQQQSLLLQNTCPLMLPRVFAQPEQIAMTAIHAIGTIA